MRLSPSSPRLRPVAAVLSTVITSGYVMVTLLRSARPLFVPATLMPGVL